MLTNDSADLRPLPLRHAIGGIIVLVVVTVIIGGIASLSLAWVAPGIKSFPVVPRLGVQRALSPIDDVLRGAAPGSAEQGGGTASGDVRVIRLIGERIVLIVGGRPYRVIVNGSTTFDLEALVAEIADPAWIQETTPGQIDVMTGLVVDQGARLEISAPATETVVLDDRPGVLLGAIRGGHLVFDGVEVRSNSAGRPESQEYRPMVLATKGAAMRATDTAFTNLGWNWHGSYGVTWSDDATGGAVRSVFDSSFIGVYTSHVHGLHFFGCSFTNNDLYGLDPHSSSTDIVVDKALAANNKAHGIIFSQDVSGSMVKRSIARNNGENGIMMDARSTGNTITDNLVEDNAGDGIVTSDSGDTTIQGNTLRRNRVGLHIDPADGGTVLIDDNRILGNRLSYQGISLPDGNTEQENGGQWRFPELRAVWTVATVALGIGIVFVILGNRILRRRIVLRQRAGRHT
jgi:mannuronan 5-epimerase